MNTNIKRVRIILKAGSRKTSAVGDWHSNVQSVYLTEEQVVRAAKRLCCNVNEVCYSESPAVVKVVPEAAGATWKLSRA